ncbi:hypothetical protein H1S04_03440 [Paracoccus sp. S1E-3]|nr:hypothetical protein [Paracoccus sp. S1E-3]
MPRTGSKAEASRTPRLAGVVRRTPRDHIGDGEDRRHDRPNPTDHPRITLQAVKRSPIAGDERAFHSPPDPA